MKRLVPFLALAVLLSGLVLAQRRFGRSGGYTEGGRSADRVQTPRELDSHSTGTPTWENTRGFEKDTFTFTRVRYNNGGGFYRSRGPGWTTDTPDADLNLSYRLQQMTSIRTNPDGYFIDLTADDLSSYPWIYIVEPGGLHFDEAEVAALRKYLLNGGFLMFDDFWGESAWQNVERNMKRVFPERSFAELPLDHPLYRSVFEIKSKGQVPNVRTGEESQATGVTWEYGHDGDTRTVHHRAIHDDKGRMMVIATHNTDNGDGWEREGEYEYYFRNFSEKIAYPLGINIIFYVMTH
ncbi:MAG: DUF4159 domain-containing protein [Opitutaceae bacterium]|nr:DUF4159 domain-containing protein [Opitutaceae bacterium]